MSTQNHIALGTKRFRFFDLPREPRDDIFDLLSAGRRIIYKTMEKSQSSNTEYSLQLEFEDRPLPRFLLVNKQFGDGYSQRAVKKRTLHIHDLRGSQVWNTALPATALDADHITFKLASC